MTKKRIILYSCILLALAAAAVWVLVEPDELKELKQFEAVTAGAEDAVAVVNEALRAVEAKDTDLLADCMLNGHDRTEVESLTALLYAEPEFCPAVVAKCFRLVKSHRQDNLTVYVVSEKRKKTYAFTMLKNREGEYKIGTVVPSSRKF